MKPTYHVFVSTRGNVFMAEIASLIAAALGDLGYDTVHPAAGLPERRRNRVNLVVAPHEFFPLQQGVPESDLLRAAEQCVTVGVEQPGTPWFDLGARYSSVAEKVLDISAVAVRELRSRGIPAEHLQLGYHRSWDRWGGRADQTRPTDVLFLGSVARRRESLLSSMAPLLWDCRTDIRFFEFRRPMTEARGHFVTSDEKWALLAASRILLNIHRGELAYFEWVRVLEAITNGCLVVTEASDEYGPLMPGEHLVAAPGDCLGAYAASLAVDEPLRAEMARAAYDLIRTTLQMTAMLEPLCEDLQAGAGTSTPRPAPAPAPMPAEPLALTAEHPLIEDVLASEMRIRARVKQLIDSETALVRTVEGMQAELEWGDPEHADAWCTPAWNGFQPDTTVLITTYNSEEFVADSIRTVFDSTGVAVDLIVIDDHSTDATVPLVREVMDSFPQFPALLLSRAANAGVSVARNQGVKAARGRYVFILDADNEIYPTAIARLSAALDGDPQAAFAYGIVAKSNDEGLLSHLPWDVPRLCEANYVDAMAAIRRSALDDLGGYELRFGWEDYDLWLRFASAGLRGVFVPAFVGRYSVRSGSMLETVNLDQDHLRAELRRRYRHLPWP